MTSLIPDPDPLITYALRSIHATGSCYVSAQDIRAGATGGDGCTYRDEMVRDSLGRRLEHRRLTVPRHRVIEGGLRVW